MGTPLVSVVMATFNEPAIYINASIQSILGQSYPNFELIIVDDSTQKDTVCAIDRFADRNSRIRLIRHKERMGFVNALNEGLKVAHGEYIARMDGDDIALPDRLEKQVSYLEQHRKVMVLGGAMNIIDGKGLITSERKYPQSGVKLHLWTIFRNPLAHPTVMFRSSLVKEGFYYDKTQKKAEDIELWLRLKRHGYCMENLSDKLINYRVVGNLALKRNREQWQYNFRARRKNFTWRNPLFSLFSIGISWVYIHISTRIIEVIYKNENRKRMSKIEI